GRSAIGLRWRPAGTLGTRSGAGRAYPGVRNSCNGHVQRVRPPGRRHTAFFAAHGRRPSRLDTHDAADAAAHLVPTAAPCLPVVADEPEQAGRAATAG